MLKIVVTFAVAAEFAPWRRKSGFEATGNTYLQQYVKRTRSADVYVLITGVGMRAVEDDLRLLLSDADICIASGLAGSLQPQHCSGMVFAAKRVGRSGPERVLESDTSLLELARCCGANEVDLLWTENSVLSSAKEKALLGTIAEAVDMESAHVLRQAKECGIPSIAIRAISDAVGTNMPIDFNRVIDKRGRIGFLSTFWEIVRKPHRVPQLIRFGLESTRARRNLAQFLDQFTSLVVGARDMQFSPARAEMK